ncbi:hypothetical protein [Algibacter sp. 2305UL17-15]|uniref:hypothetical protein n=1 Tax=Algibacter sp. 2305UL17-15 TaxID=3231268 RepID=UPI003458BFB2
MKKTALVIATLLFVCKFGFAQLSFEVVEEKLPYSHWATSYTTNIIGYGQDFVLQKWQNHIGELGGKTYVESMHRGNIELRSENVKFPILNDEKVTIYTRLKPNSTLTGVMITLWIQTKDGTYFSTQTHPEEAKKMKKWMMEFNVNLKKQNQKIIYN